MNTEDTGRTPGQAAYDAWRAHPAPVSHEAWEAAARAAIDASTAEDPQAELAALRELLAAIVAAASVPLPASEGNPADMQAYYETRSNRLNYINLTAALQPGGSALLIRSNAEALTRLAAEPLPYEAEGEQT